MKHYSSFLQALVVALTFASSGMIADEPRTWGQVKDDVQAGVVCVKCVVAPPRPFEPFKPIEHEGACHGSGFLFEYNHKIYIGTNAHVVHDSRKIEIALPNICGPAFKAECRLRGYYAHRDIAVIELTEEGDAKLRAELKSKAGFNGVIPTLDLGDSNDIKGGEDVVIIGYPLVHELKYSVGNISGYTTISWGDDCYFIQTNAPTSGGNSGGPAFTSDEKIIGILTGTRTDGQNFNMLIPITHFKKALPYMLSGDPDTPVVVHSNIGISTQTIDSTYLMAAKCPEKGGILLTYVVKGGEADRAGLHVGDIITHVNDLELDFQGYIKNEWNDLCRFMPEKEMLNQIEFGDKFTYTVYRDGAKKKITLQRPTDDPRLTKKVMPGIEPIPYLAFGGMVLENIGHIHEKLIFSQHQDGMSVRSPELLACFSQPTVADTPRVVISRVYPASSADETETLNQGDIIAEINGTPVSTLDEVSAVFAAVTSPYLFIKTLLGKQCVIDLKRAIADESHLIRNHGYTPASFLETLTQRFA